VYLAAYRCTRFFETSLAKCRHPYQTLGNSRKATVNARLAAAIKAVH
jgi:hypothetical protein